MKKILALLLIMLMILSLCACGKTKQSGSSEKEQAALSIPVSDDFVIENARYYPAESNDGTIEVSLKIKNNTTVEEQMIDFYYNSYDKDGNLLHSGISSVKHYKAGESVWVDSFKTEATKEEFASIKIDKYVIREWKDKNTASYVGSVDVTPRAEVLFEQMSPKK